MSRCAVLLAFVLVGGISACGSAPASDRQQEIAERGAVVMPFDLDATTHVFTPTASGGVQAVVADDPDDVDSVAFVQEHLRFEAERFRVGDFSDPERIHGDAMPGLAVLKDRYREIDVEFEATSIGATIVYSSQAPEVVDAVHAWFDAQVSDHGDHAQHGQ